MKPIETNRIASACKFGTKNSFDKDAIERFKAYYDNVCKQTDDFFNVYLNAKNIKFDKRHVSIPFEKGRINVEILPENFRSERRKLRDEARKVLFDDVVEELQWQLEAKKLPYAKIDTRDYQVLFANIKIDENEMIKGTSVAKKLDGQGFDRYDDKTKNELFKLHIDELMKNLIKYSQPCSDEQFLKNFKILNACAKSFMNDNIKQHFSGFAHCKMDDNVYNLYKSYSNYANQLYNSVNLRMARLTDSCYEYMLDDDLNKFGQYVFESGEINLFDEHQNKDGIKINPVDALGEHFCFLKYSNLGKNPVDDLKALKYINDGDIIVGENGVLNEDEANKALGKNKLLGIKDKDGNLKVVGFDNVMRAYSKDINKNFDKKASYKNLLGILNKGTRILNKSSDEYKNMRNILSDLSKGKGNEKELIASLKENANKYIRDYYYKDKISNLATERKTCVENMLKGLENLELNASVGEYLRNNSRELENVQVNNNVVNKKLVLADVSEEKNSSFTHLSEQEKNSITKTNVSEINTEITKNNL